MAKLRRCCPRITRPGFAWLTAHLPARVLFREPSLTCGAVTSVKVRASLNREAKAWSVKSLPDGNEQVPSLCMYFPMTVAYASRSVPKLNCHNNYSDFNYPPTGLGRIACTA